MEKQFVWRAVSLSMRREGDEINRVDCEGVLGVGNCSIEPEKVENPSLFCVRHWPGPCEVPSDPSDIGTVTFHWPQPAPDPNFKKCERNPSSYEPYRNEKRTAKVISIFLSTCKRFNFEQFREFQHFSFDPRLTITMNPAKDEWKVNWKSKLV